MTAEPFFVRCEMNTFVPRAMDRFYECLPSICTHISERRTLDGKRFDRRESEIDSRNERQRQRVKDLIQIVAREIVRRLAGQGSGKQFDGPLQQSSGDGGRKK